MDKLYILDRSGRILFKHCTASSSDCICAHLNENICETCAQHTFTLGELEESMFADAVAPFLRCPDGVHEITEVGNLKILVRGWHNVVIALTANESEDWLELSCLAEVCQEFVSNICGSNELDASRIVSKHGKLTVAFEEAFSNGRVIQSDASMLERRSKLKAFAV